MFHKRGTPYSWWYVCQILTDFHNSFTGRFSNQFAVKWLLKVPPQWPHLACIATLPCETLMSKNAIIDTLQGVATNLRCGGVVNNQINNGLLLSLPEKNWFWNRSIFGEVISKKVLSSALCAPGHHAATRRRKCITKFTGESDSEKFLKIGWELTAMSLASSFIGARCNFMFLRRLSWIDNGREKLQ